MSASGGFAAAAAADRAWVERRCEELVGDLASHHVVMRDAVRYALLGGGKRLRAILCLWTHDFVRGGARDAACDAACAVECVHAYSLVHDDLPCMDDDDFRRGQPSCHARFGEATAVLAGDALLNLAFEILATSPSRHETLSAGTVLRAVRALSHASGTGGLITGQALDLESEGVRGASVADVERIHANKTARLFAASMELGALFGGAGEATCGAVRDVGLLAGRAFQIADDVLDLGADKETLGKTPGKDVKKGKLTYPAVVGVEGSRAEALALVERAKAVLWGVRGGGDGDALCSIIDSLVERAA